MSAPACARDGLRMWKCLFKNETFTEFATSKQEKCRYTEYRISNTIIIINVNIKKYDLGYTGWSTHFPHRLAVCNDLNEAAMLRNKIVFL